VLYKLFIKFHISKVNLTLIIIHLSLII